MVCGWGAIQSVRDLKNKTEVSVRVGNTTPVWRLSSPSENGASPAYLSLLNAMTSQATWESNRSLNPNSAFKQKSLHSISLSWGESRVSQSLAGEFSQSFWDTQLMGQLLCVPLSSWESSLILAAVIKYWIAVPYWRNIWAYSSRVYTVLYDREGEAEDCQSHCIHS